MIALALLACDVGEPEALPQRVAPTPFASARSWVQDITTDGQQVFWGSYDVSTGRSARAVIDRAQLEGDGSVELAERRHPPKHLEVADGWVYWSYEIGPLQRAPVAGGPTETVLLGANTTCFAADATGVYLFDTVDLIHVTPDGTQRVVAEKGYGECPVLFGDRVYWNERKGVFSVPQTGGTPEKLADVSKPEGLVVHDDALYACVEDTLTRIDPKSGAHQLVRSFCKGDGLAVSDGGHWFRYHHFAGWPAEKQWRVAEVTKHGVSWLFDGKDVSHVEVIGEEVVFFGREHGSPDWKGYRAPVPTP